MSAPSTGGARPIESTAGNSPVDVDIPFWITACVRLQPPRRRNGAEISASLANAVFPAVQALMADRLRTDDDEDGQDQVSVPLDRERLARRCGLGDAKKAGWLFEYLETIGFVRIRRHHRGIGRGRNVDTFKVYEQPPLNYVGPRTHAELERALDHPDRATSSILFVSETAGQTEGSGFGTFREDPGAESGTLVGKAAGQTEGSGSGSFSIDQRSSISEREIEEIEPVPGGTAEPPATGLDERQAAAVRELVRRLPWAQWAKRANSDFRLSPVDADAVQAAICSAMATASVTLDQAAEIGRTALGQAKTTPVTYVIDAFGPKHLPRRLRELDAEPLSDDPLPLPGNARPENAPAARTKPAGAKPAELVLGKCDTCRCNEGDPKFMRRVEGPDGRAGWCPDCVPNEAA